MVQSPSLNYKSAIQLPPRDWHTQGKKLGPCVLMWMFLTISLLFAVITTHDISNDNSKLWLNFHLALVHIYTVKLNSVTWYVVCSPGLDINHKWSNLNHHRERREGAVNVVQWSDGGKKREVCLWLYCTLFLSLYLLVEVLKMLIVWSRKCC